MAIIGLAVELTACLGIWVLSQSATARPATVPSGEAESKAPGPVAGLDRIAREIIANGGQFVAKNADLAKVLGVSPSCASKWRKAWREAGDIIEARRDGLLVLSLGRRRFKPLAAA